MYKRRIKLFLAFIGAVCVVLGVKLWNLQIIQGQGYREAFAESLVDKDILPAQRGQIVDRNGLVLARDKPCYDLRLDYRFLVGNEKWQSRQIRRLAKENGIEDSQAQAMFLKCQERTWKLAAEAAARRKAQDNGLPWEEDPVAMEQARKEVQDTALWIIRRVEGIHLSVGGPVEEERMSHVVVSGLDDPMLLEGTIGASLTPSLRRWAPRHDLACHIVGVVGEIDRETQDRWNAALNIPPGLDRRLVEYHGGDLVGISGTELMAEPILRGRAGYIRRESGTITHIEPPQPGRDVRLTIDAELQEQLTDLLSKGGAQGSAVVVSVETGEILAMVSTPTYDLNRYRTDIRMLGSNEIDLPLNHRAVQRRYPPGSTAKVITALAGLGEEDLTPQTMFTCAGLLYPEHPTMFRCNSTFGHGSIDLVTAIKKSCNVYFYHVGHQLGPQRLGDWFRLFGFGDLPGTGLPQEVVGGAPAQGDPRNWAIGQGELEVTPLHVANAMAAIARGEYLSPRIAFDDGPSNDYDTRRAIPPQVRRTLSVERGGELHAVRPGDLQAVRQGMWEVVNENGGTGYRVFRPEGAWPLDVVVCGKTGTADCEPLRADLNHDGRVDRDEIARTGNMAWFAGYASYTHPRIAFAVVVEYVAGHGGTEAGPYARELVRLCQARGYVD